jgi:ABC-type multidrug transport system fused ATPase/permease subunit
MKIFRHIQMQFFPERLCLNSKELVCPCRTVLKTLGVFKVSSVRVDLLDCKQQPSREDEEELWAALGIVGLQASLFKAGLDTLLGEHVDDTEAMAWDKFTIHDYAANAPLSLGQMQRLVLARSVVKLLRSSEEIELMVLDEPTADLDLLGSGTFLANLKNMKRGKAIVLIICIRPHG